MSWLTRCCAFLSGVALLTMAFLGVADIVGIHLFGQPVPGMVELTSSLMVATIFLGLPLTEARGQNVRVEVLSQQFPRPVRRVLDLVARLSMATLFGFVAWFGLQQLIRSIETNEYAQGLIEVPYWPARLALVIGEVLVAVLAIHAGLRQWRTGVAVQDEGVTWKV